MNVCTHVAEVCLLLILIVGIGSVCTQAKPVLPEGIEAVKVDMLPHEGFGTAEEVYSSGIADAVVGLRRAMHAQPGVMYDEYFASETSVSTLRLMGVSESNIKTGLGVTGVVAHIGAGSLESTMRSDSSVRTITLRADMDALPIHEETDVAFKSTVDGVMHACGHDAHTAMLLGAAMLLKRHESELVAMNAAVRLFFQPAEEGGAGAKALVDAGAIDGTSAGLALHVSSWAETGTFGTVPGRICAACYNFVVTISGVGAHGAAPHQSKDPIAAAGAIVSGIHQIVSRTIIPTDAAVISIGYINGGKAFNVIPDEVTLGGTIRLTDMALFDSVWQTLTLRIAGIAEAYGCSAEVINRNGEKGLNSRGEEFTIYAFPPLVNADSMVDLGVETVTNMYGAGATIMQTTASSGCEGMSCTHDDHTTYLQVLVLLLTSTSSICVLVMSPLDFAFLSEREPAVAFNIGIKHPNDKPKEGTGVQVHNPLFKIDERALPRGSAFMSTLVLEWAKQQLNDNASADGEL